MYQAEKDFPGVVSEQYADCLAGAWLREMYDTKVVPFDNPGSLDAAVAAMVSFRDEPGSSPDDDDAHGSGFDRVRAIQEGFDDGEKFCATYETDLPKLTQVVFDADDKANQGNLPLKEISDLSVSLLERFAEAAPDAVEPNAQLTNPKELKRLHDNFGDGALLTVRVLDAAAAKQKADGKQPDDLDQQLDQACTVGVFLRWLDTSELPDAKLSAGDLDEAVSTFADLTDPSSSGFFFDQMTALRQGFIVGPTACQQ
jgi:hypothetical protein